MVNLRKSGIPHQHYQAWKSGSSFGRFAELVPCKGGATPTRFQRASLSLSQKGALVELSSILGDDRASLQASDYAWYFCSRSLITMHFRWVIQKRQRQLT